MGGLSQLIKELGPVKLAVMGIVSLLLMVSLVLLSARLSDPALVPLFSNLDGDDSAKIAARLESSGVYYEMRNGGTQIMVPSRKVLSVRMQLAQEGLPTGQATVGYEIFDRSTSVGISSFVHNVNLVRALEGELSRTITAFDHIAAAKVHLVVPRQDLFAKRRQDPRASVVLKMRGNRPLSRSEVAAIAHLVVTAVPDLNINNITIVDTKGRPFKKGGGDANDPAMAASSAEEYRAQVENRLKNVIEELLMRSVGIGSVEAQVSADIDFDRIITDSEIFDPDGQVARSVSSSEESATSTEGAGGVTALNNLPEGTVADGAAGRDDSSRLNESTTFEVSRTVKKHIKEAGSIKRLSIAVLVDGKYEYDEEAEERIYQERTQEELDKLALLVKSAVGFDEGRGDSVEVINMQFTNEIQGVVEENPWDWVTRDLGSVVQTLVIGLVVTLIVLLVVKPMVARAFTITQTETQEAELQAALAEGDLAELSEITGLEEGGVEKKSDNLIDVDSFEQKMQSSSLKAVNDIIERHPNEAVTIIRSWLDEDKLRKKKK